VKGFRPRPFGSEVGSQVHHRPRFQRSPWDSVHRVFPRYGSKLRRPSSSRRPFPVRSCPRSAWSPATSVQSPVWPSLRESRYLVTVSPAPVRAMHCHSLLLSPEALAPAAFCCRCHHRLPASSASVLLSVPLPATDG